MTSEKNIQDQNATDLLSTGPDEQGHFGIYGGRYVPETLMPLILSVEKAWEEAKEDISFWAEFHELARDYIGRPSPLYFAEATTKHFANGDDKGAQIWFKRDELNHTGAHKINGITYDRENVSYGEIRPIDDDLCLMMIKELCGS